MAGTKTEAFKQVLAESLREPAPALLPRELTLPLDGRKVISLWGARRTGKTSLLHATMQAFRSRFGREAILFAGLDDDRLGPLGPADLQSLIDAWHELHPEIAGRELVLCLDEVQAAHGWERFVRRLHGTGRYRLFVTGSSSVMQAEEIASALRGRTLTFEVLPLSYREYLGFAGIHPEREALFSEDRYVLQRHLEEFMAGGGFPEVVLAPQVARRKLLQEYIQYMFYRDIVDRHNLRNRTLARYMLRYLLANVGTEFSVAGFHKAVRQHTAASRDTVYEYYDAMAGSGVFFPVRPFNLSVGGGLAGRPKTYCVDTGLALAGSLGLLQNHGRLAENVVFLELRRRGYEVSYWRDKNEVDFVAVSGAGVLLVNVHWASGLHPRELRGFDAFAAAHPRLPVERLLLTRDYRDDASGVRCLPLLEWLLDFRG